MVRPPKTSTVCEVSRAPSPCFVSLEHLYLVTLTLVKPPPPSYRPAVFNLFHKAVGETAPGAPRRDALRSVLRFSGSCLPLGFSYDPKKSFFPVDLCSPYIAPPRHSVGRLVAHVPCSPHSQPALGISHVYITPTPLRIGPLSANDSRDFRAYPLYSFTLLVHFLTTPLSSPPQTLSRDRPFLLFLVFCPAT